METSEKSQLPVWEPERFNVGDESGSYDMLRCTCHSCKQTFWVAGNWSKWSPPSADVGTRPCPYCFRTAWLPEFQPGAGAPRRVVKRRKKR